MQASQHTRQARELFEKIRTAIFHFLFIYQKDMIEQVFKGRDSLLGPNQPKELVHQRLLAVAEETSRRLKARRPSVTIETPQRTLDRLNRRYFAHPNIFFEELEAKAKWFVASRTTETLARIDRVSFLVGMLNIEDRGTDARNKTLMESLSEYTGEASVNGGQLIPPLKSSIQDLIDDDFFIKLGKLIVVSTEPLWKMTDQQLLLLLALDLRLIGTEKNPHEALGDHQLKDLDPLEFFQGLQDKIKVLNNLLSAAVINNTYAYYEIQEASDAFDVLIQRSHK